MKKIAATIALATSALVLAGCTASTGGYSLDTSHLSSYKTIDALAAAYTEAGGDCETFNDYPTIPGNESAMCPDGTQLLIMSEANVTELRKSVNEGTALMGVQVVNGADWGILTLDTSKNEALAEALDGEVIKEK